MLASQEKPIWSNSLLMRINLNHPHCHPWEEFGLVKICVSGDLHPEVTAHVIDGAAVVNMRKPKTFGEYVEINLLPYFISKLEHVSRLDVVWDQYLSTQQLKRTWSDSMRRRY